MVAEHYGRAAALGAAADLDPAELERDRGAGARRARGGRRRLRLAVLQPGGAGPLRDRARRSRPTSTRDRARIAEKLGDVACGSAASTAGGRGLGAVPRVPPRRGGPGPGRRPAPQDRRRPLAQGRPRGVDRALPAGIDLLKDGPPCIELVRLYEEAASLYMHTGDNMLAIYASEKALRLAERLGEAAAASRAHGIFGRVFGRIGDSSGRARTSSARSSWRARPTRARRCGRCSRSATTSRSPRPTTRAPRGLRRGARPAARDRRPALAGRAARGARPARGLPRRLGGGRARDRGLGDARRARGPGRQALLPLLDARDAAWREGDLDRAVELLERALEIAEQVGRSEVAFEALFWLAAALRDRGDHADADQALARALDLCERAGLIAQSVEATSARAVNLALWGKRRGGARGGRGGDEPRRPPALPGRPARRASRRGAPPPPILPSAPAARRGARGLGAARPPDRRRPLRRARRDARDVS